VNTKSPSSYSYPWLTRFLGWLLLSFCYFAAGKAGLTLAFVNASATAVWPPTGIAIAACVLFGLWAWPGILLGAFLVNVTTSGSIPTSIVIAIGNTLEGLAGAYLVQRFARGTHAFDRAQDIFKFSLLAGLVAPAISATIGVASLAVGGLAAWTEIGPIWLTWWLGDVTGALIVAPLVILWATRPRMRWPRRKPWEAALLLVTLGLQSMLLFGGWSRLSTENYPLAFTALPLIVWAAYRFGPRVTATVCVLLSVVAVWGTLHGLGPFARPSANEALVILQAFLGTVTMSGLILAALTADNARMYTQSLAVNAALEIRVAQRTEQLESAETAAQAASQRLLATREEERAAIAREIHDQLGGQLTSLKFDLANLRKALDQNQMETVQRVSNEMNEAIDTTISLVRQIAAELRPAILDNFGLLAAIEWQVGDFERRTGIKGSFRSEIESVALASDTETAIFRVCQEALTNIARHSGATEFAVTVQNGSQDLLVVIHDNGRGISEAALNGGRTLGLQGMHERIQLAHGTLQISGGPSQGTTVSIHLPHQLEYSRP